MQHLKTHYFGHNLFHFHRRKTVTHINCIYFVTSTKILGNMQKLAEYPLAFRVFG